MCRFAAQNVKIEVQLNTGNIQEGPVTPSNEIRKTMALLEAVGTPHTGMVTNGNATYLAYKTAGRVSKVVAKLSAQQGSRFTKLGRDLMEIEALAKKMEDMKANVRQEDREALAGLFLAEDKVCTRVVETANFVFHMSKDPEAATTTKWAKVMEELQGHLTPELQKVMASLVEKHSTLQKPKAASLKAYDPNDAPKEESISEGLMDGIKAFMTKLNAWIDRWDAKYEAELEKLKAWAEIPVGESLAEAPAEDDEEGIDDASLDRSFSAEDVAGVARDLFQRHLSSKGFEEYVVERIGHIDARNGMAYFSIETADGSEFQLQIHLKSRGGRG
jgi:hypothetical protein